MKIISYSKPIPTPKLIYGVGLVLFGVTSIMSGQYIGFMFIGLSLYFLKTNGVEFDISMSKYRYTTKFFGLTFGKWLDTPDIEYVSVFKSNQTSRVWVSTASTNVTSTTIQVNLFYNTNRKIEAYETQKVDDAFKKAKEIAMAFNIDILDATERESKWL